MSSREHATRTHGANKSDMGEPAKRERLTGRLRAVVPWCVTGAFGNGLEASVRVSFRTVVGLARKGRGRACPSLLEGTGVKS